MKEKTELLAMISSALWEDNPVPTLLIYRKRIQRR